MRVIVLIVGAVVYAFMIAEARRAAVNERRQRRRGGVEPAGDVYALMQFAYPGIFFLMFAEGFWRATVDQPMFVIGLMVLATAKALKWWAIVTLGDCWTFRVIVVPGTVAVSSGPYRLLRHPNYVAVVGEIVGVTLMMDARVTGPLALLIFGALLLRRIQVENRALGAILPPN